MLARLMAYPSTQAPERTAPAERPRESIRLIAAVTAAWTVSLFAYYAQSMLLGPIMSDFGQGEEAVGWLFSVENTALALTILVAAGPLARLSRSRVALAGGLLVVAGNIVSAFVGSYEVLLATRWVVGMGSGLVGAAGTAAAASTRDPVRVFAIVTVSWNVVAGAEPAVIPYVTVPFGASGGFLLLAGVGAALMPLFVWLLPPREAPGEKPSLFAAPNRSLALVAMLGLFVYEVGQGGVWTFVGQIGERSGLTEYAVGRTLTGATYLGLIGGVVAGWLGSRFGRRGPIAIGIALNVAAAVGLALRDDPISFVTLNWLWVAAYTFVVPYLMGVMASMDDLGRWVVASDGVWTLGDAAGPGIAGSLVERGGYGHLALLALLCGLVCIWLMMRVLRRLEPAPSLPAADRAAPLAPV